MISKLTYLFFLLVGFSLYGQDLNQEVSESHLSIGQPITLTYRIKTAKHDSINFQPNLKSILGRSISRSGNSTKDQIEFEILREFSDSTLIENDQKIWIGKYTITAWDSGAYVIPGPRVIINDSVFEFENIAIACYLVDPIDGIDIYDIKESFVELPREPFSLRNFLQKNWWWILIVLIVVIFYFRKKKKKPIKEDTPLSLEESTLAAIQALENEKLWENEQLKEHFIKLSYILRSYLTSRYEISLLEKTTNETRLLLTQKGLNEETVKVISKILSQSDMVKFAKSKPDTISILNVSNLAKQIVIETNLKETDHVE